jgi:hypothetical protein
MLSREKVNFVMSKQLKDIALQWAGLILVWACSDPTWAQATIKRDGQWRSALGIGGSVSSGNNRSTNLTMTGEAVRATTRSKWSMTGRLLYATAQGDTTTDNKALGLQFDKDVSDEVFASTTLEYLKDQPANLNARVSWLAGPGWHLVDNDDTTIDVTAGLAYTQDQFVHPALVAEALRSGYSRGEWMAGEQSTHRLSNSASFRQKLTLFTNTSRTGGSRFVFEAGLSMAINSRMNLTTGYTHHYEKDRGLGLKNSNGLLITGISFKLD